MCAPFPLNTFSPRFIQYFLCCISITLHKYLLTQTICHLATATCLRIYKKARVSSRFHFVNNQSCLYFALCSLTMLLSFLEEIIFPLRNFCAHHNLILLSACYNIPTSKLLFWETELDIVLLIFCAVIPRNSYRDYPKQCNIHKQRHND